MFEMWKWTFLKMNLDNDVPSNENRRCFDENCRFLFATISYFSTSTFSYDLLTYCTLNNIISLAWKCNSAVTLQPLFITITIDNDKSAVRLIYNNFTRTWSCIIVLLTRIHLRACNEKLFMKLWIHKVVVSNV